MRVDLGGRCSCRCAEPTPRSSLVLLELPAWCAWTSHRWLGRSRGSAGPTSTPMCLRLRGASMISEVSTPARTRRLRDEPGGGEPAVSAMVLRHVLEACRGRRERASRSGQTVGGEAAEEASGRRSATRAGFSRPREPLLARTSQRRVGEDYRRDATLGEEASGE